MVHRWRCRQCDFTVWAADGTATVEVVKSHLMDHHRTRLSRDDFQIRWECPYCDTERQIYDGDGDEGVQTFKDHLFEHARPLLESGVHVADDVDGTGSIVVQAPVEGTGADNARRHFLSAGDIVLLVTTNPAERIRLMQRGLKSWPAWTVILTTVDDPLSGVEGVDVADVPVEVVKLDRVHSLQEVGQTISKIVAEQDTANGKLSVEFDILPEIISKFELQTVFRFLHILSSRLEKADALTHYYINPESDQRATSNILESVFDMTIAANGAAFTSQTR